MFAIDYLHTHNQPHLKIYPRNIFIKNDRLILGEIGFRTQLEHYNQEIRSIYYPKDEQFSLKTDIWSQLNFINDILSSFLTLI